MCLKLFLPVFNFFTLRLRLEFGQEAIMFIFDLGKRTRYYETGLLMIEIGLYRCKTITNFKKLSGIYFHLSNSVTISMGILVSYCEMGLHLRKTYTSQFSR